MGRENREDDFLTRFPQSFPLHPARLWGEVQQERTGEESVLKQTHARRKLSRKLFPHCNTNTYPCDSDIYAIF